MNPEKKVVTSEMNFPVFKTQLQAHFLKRFDKKYVDVFMSIISSRYDNIGRLFLDKKIMWRLLSDHANLKNDSMLLYAVVGLGGSGKTTLANNIAYFHDGTYRSNRIIWNYTNELETVISSFNVDGTFQKYKAFIVDEPNDNPSSQSKEGKAISEVFGQMRQINPICIFCSTDMKDIPPTAFRKLSAIIYLNSKGHGLFIRDDPYRGEYPLSDLKRNYLTYGYKAFQKMIDSRVYPFLEFWTAKGNCLEYLEKGCTVEYLKDKKKHFMNSLGKLVPKKKGRNSADGDNRTVKERILELHDKGLTNTEITKELGTSRTYVSDAIMTRYWKK